MSRDFAQSTIVGRLTRDIEVTELAGGTKVAKFSVASNYRKKTQGEFHDEVSFFDVEAWRQWEPIQEFLVKGKQVLVSGNMRQDRWEDKEGQKRSKIVLTAEQIVLLGGNPGESSSPSSVPRSPSYSPPSSPFPTGNDEKFDGEPPF